MSDYGTRCPDPWPHDPHRYNDDGVYRNCSGLHEAVCKSPRCPRPGINAAGFCCHGCAANARFGHTLLHGRQCEDTNPGVEEITAPLRDQVTAALHQAILQPCETTCPKRIAAHLTAAVMEVVDAEQEHARADALFWAARELRKVPLSCTALTGPYWYGQGWTDAADHLMDLAGWEPSDGEAERTRLAARVRDLEDQLAGARQAALDEAANYLSGLSSYGTSWQFARKIQSIDVKAQQIQGPGYTAREMLERFEGDET